MNETAARRPTERLHDQLEAVVELLRQHDDEGLTASATSALCEQLDELHPADIAFILESLPLDDRLALWQLVKADRDGETLLEVSDAVRDSLIADMDRHEILA
ncbi:MAG: magnesium transporter, partial [Rhodanobacter sp.]